MMKKTNSFQSNRVFTSLLSVTFLSLMACSGQISSNASETEKKIDKTQVKQSTAALIPLSSCETLPALLKEQALFKMNEAMDAELERIKQNPEEIACPPPPSQWADAGAVIYDDPAEEGVSSGAASSSTGTNNQVSAVDEADFVKHDGKYMYVAQNGALQIFEAYPAPSAHAVSKLSLPGMVKKLFLAEGKALVNTSLPQNEQGYGYPSGSECTYGYNCEMGGDGSRTLLVEVDLSNKAKPSIVRQVEFSSSFLAARRIGSTVHTVLSKHLSTYLREVQTTVSLSSIFAQGSVDSAGLCNANAATQIRILSDEVERLRRENEKIIEAHSFEGDIPTVSDSRDSQAQLKLCQSYYKAPLADGSEVTTLHSLNLSAQNDVKYASIFGKSGTVYASEDALYLSSTHRKEMSPYAWYESSQEDVLSEVHKFRIGATPAQTAYMASGLVKGRALNQFSMDAKDGFLRIATTNGQVPDPNVSSQLSVLEQVGNNLVVKGAVTDIAKGEDIRSVRFDGDRAFVVTFKKTDPLFYFDLANPSAPRLVSELKIPGFSTYIHMLDASHLLTIGYDADDHGDFAYFDGVLLQIFDVSNPNQLQLTHKEVIGTRGSSSEALTNHLAFTYYKEKSLLALPMTICEGGDDGQYGATMSFSGLLLRNVSVLTGFSEKGRIAHPPQSTGSYNNAACSNWWTNASSEVKRSVFMDNYVYSISNEVIRIRDLNNVSSPLVDLPLQ